MQELTALCILIPLDPWILAVIEACKSCLDNFKRLRLLTNSNYLTSLNIVRWDVYNFTINSDVLVVYKLTCCCTSRSNTKTEHYIVKTTLQFLKKNLTSDTVSLSCLFEHITELTLKNTISVLSFLLLCQHDTVLRHFSATVVAMLSRREVSLGQNFVSAEDWFTKSACNFRFRTCILSHNI